MKWAIVGGVALLVVLWSMRARANPYDARNWDYLDGYKPQSGVIL